MTGPGGSEGQWGQLGPDEGSGAPDGAVPDGAAPDGAGPHDAVPHDAVPYDFRAEARKSDAEGLARRA